MKLKDKNIIPWIVAILVTTLVFMILPMVNAEIQSLSTGKINQEMSLTQTVTNSTYCNISKITYPNNTILNLNNLMTKSNNDYNYSFTPNSLGEYSYITCCNPDLIDTCVGITFIVTDTGQIVSLSNIIIVISFLVLAILFFVIGYSFNQDKWILKSSFFIFALLMGLISINSARIISSESESIGRMVDTGFILLIAIILFFFLYTFIIWTIQTFQSVKKKGAVRWDY